MSDSPVVLVIEALADTVFFYHLYTTLYGSLFLYAVPLPSW